jgi:hypothetical protein
MLALHAGRELLLQVEGSPDEDVIAVCHLRGV